jgi:murein DD-endopeptidase MepM/ murein hydrolase activator NlpD
MKRWLALLTLLLAGCSAGVEQASAPTATLPAAIATTMPSPPASDPTAPSALSTATVAQPSAPAASDPVGPSAPAAPTATPAPTLAASPPAIVTATPGWSYPIGLPGQPLGDGFFIRHGYATENTWYNPGDLHTGEDWYALQGDTAGAEVVAAAAGEVVYAGSNYPGRVVIVQHAADLFSMYGHLDPALAVDVGQQVARGDRLGVVLRRGDDVPNHLHFEIRSFLIAAEVNGPQPRYGYRCGPGCVPGPGYWPINAPDRPDALGWRNPTHVINGRMLPDLDSGAARGEVVVASDPISDSVTLWAAFADDGRPQDALDELRLEPGARYPLLNVRAGAEAPAASSAAAYQVWYRIALADGRTGWIAAAVPSTFETGSDGRPSTVRFNLVPAGVAAP